MSASADQKLVNPEMVTVLRESRGFTQTALAKKVNATQSLLSKVEHGLVPASAKLVSRLAEELRYPSEHFFMEERIYGPGTSEFYHRKRKSLGVRLQVEIYARLTLCLNQIRRLLRAAAITGDAFEHIDPDEIGGNAREVARAVRSIWNLPQGPVKSVAGAIEDSGGIVVRFDFRTPKVDGVSRWVSGLPPVFFVNRNIPADRERWTLAHELGHIFMHRIPNFHMEQEADLFASEFLMPKDEIRHQLWNVNLPKLAALKVQWKVSMAALLVASHNLGATTESKYRYLWMKMGKAGYKTREPEELDFPKEPTRVLQELIELHRDRLNYSIADLSALLVLNEDEVIDQYGIAPEREHQKGRLRLISLREASA